MEVWWGKLKKKFESGGEDSSLPSRSHRVIGGEGWREEQSSSGNILTERGGRFGHEQSLAPFVKDSLCYERYCPSDCPQILCSEMLIQNARLFQLSEMRGECKKITST